MSPTEDMLSSNAQLWAGATAHRFLSQVQDGTISEGQFNEWLVQDGIFAREFTRFQALLLAKAPPHHFDLLLRGMAALQDELHWFADLTAKKGLPLDAAPHPTCQKYVQFMENAAKQPYAVHAVVSWAIERSYNEAWHAHMPGMPAPYHKFAERWGSLVFCDFVAGLQRQADEALAGASPQERLEAEALFKAVCELEREFWEMAFSAGSS